MKYRLSFLFLIICLSCTEKEPRTELKSPTRGVWLTNVVSEAMFSQENIEKAVKEIKAYGFNSVFVVCWNRGYTLYPSAVMEKEFGIAIDPKHAERDPLQEVIDAAKKEGLKTYAWFEFGFSSSYEEVDGGHILRKKPHWAAIDTAGQIVSKNGFQWMNAFDPEVQQFILSLLKEVVENYELDGIQGDDRLPALPSMAGYEPYTLKLYKDSHQGADPPRNIFDSAWIDWRANLLNQFMKHLHQEVKGLNPEIEISVSPSIFPWSKEQYLQDWPTWVEEGWVDMVVPQIYRYNFESYQAELGKILHEQVDSSHWHKLYPGILLRVGDYYAQDSLLDLFVRENRKQGLEGEVFFYYEGLSKRKEFFQELYP